MWEHNCSKGAANRCRKIPFTNTFEIRLFISVKYDEIRREGVVFKRGNIANIS
jgi:hypothetical protein